MSAPLNRETQTPEDFNNRGLLKNEYASKLPSQSQQSRRGCREKWPPWICVSALIFVGVLSLILEPLGVAASPSAGVSSDMRLILHKRVQAHRGRPSWSEVNFEQTFALSNSAIVVADMRDKHWCRGATERVGRIALRMEPLLERARTSGILIIHAPSKTMSFYAGSEGRMLAQSAPHVDPPIAAPLRNPPLPLDDSNGRCDTPGDTEHRVWNRETPLLTIESGDVITGSGTEIYNVLRQLGIDTVFYMGVHANMCILNRSFGIRQMEPWAIHCIACATSQMSCTSLHRDHLCLMQPVQNS
jgi:nicotinamidase-related amidase